MGVRRTEKWGGRLRTNSGILEVGGLENWRMAGSDRVHRCVEGIGVCERVQ